MKAKIRVLITDDHSVVRQGLQTFLGLQEDIAVVGEAENGLQAVERTRRLLPDVVLMDLVMPEKDGIAATRQIRAEFPNIKIIALTSFTGDEKVFPALEAGANGYLLKDASPGEIIEAIRAAMRGDPTLHPEITQKLMGRISGRTRADPVARAEPLTEREQQVLRLIVAGLSNRDIGRELVIAEGTVKRHAHNIFQKLGVTSRLEAAARARQLGLG